MPVLRTFTPRPDLTLHFYEEGAVVADPNAPTGHRFTEVPDLTRVAFDLPPLVSAVDVEHALSQKLGPYRVVEGEDGRGRETVNRNRRTLRVNRLTPEDERTVAAVLAGAPDVLTPYETWAPLFPGFYSTIFEIPDNVTVETADGTEIEADWDTYDHEAYVKDVAAGVAEFLQRTLIDTLGADLSVTSERVVSPKYYNFGNDAIDIRVGLSAAATDALTAYLVENEDDLAVHIAEHYTSRDGFMSHYPNDVADWREATAGWTRFDAAFGVRNTPGHVLGRLLEFVLEREGVDTYDVYYGATDDIVADDYFDWPDDAFDTPATSTLPQLPFTHV